MTLYPLRFEPLLRRSIWGGRRLETTLGKSLPVGEDYSESWEISDYRDVQSIVKFGPLQGTTLAELCSRYGQQLLGTGNLDGGFPLLFKFLDAHQDLSIQVHPNDQVAATFTPPERGKTEAWVVLHADPGSWLYAGLKSGVDRQQLEMEIGEGNVQACLHRFTPEVGDCVLIPAGVVHAIGAGLLIAEIQQVSDTTFRIFDWNRLNDDGQPRPLHIQQALQVIDFKAGPVVPLRTDQSDQESTVQSLIRTDKFCLDRHRFEIPQDVGGDGRFHIISVIQGELVVADDPAGLPMQMGQTCLIPAEASPVRLDVTKPVTLLDMYLP